MRYNSISALVIGVSFWATNSVASPILDSTTETLCQTAQQMMVNTEMRSENVVYNGLTDWQGFVKSKPLENPLITHQYNNFERLDGSISSTPVTVSCKLKTAERINFAQSEMGKPPAAHAENDCRAIHLETWEQIKASLSPEQIAAIDSKLVFDQDDNTVIGPFWLKPWPYQVAYLGEDGKAHIRSKSLYVEYAWWIPMPASFMGTHYCHLAAPEFLRDVALGNVVLQPLLDE